MIGEDKGHELGSSRQRGCSLKDKSIDKLLIDAFITKKKNLTVSWVGYPTWLCL